MATITDIANGDLISASNEVINDNFDNLNTDKIETSYLDTDTAMAANSDVKIPSQKAVKTYIDTSGGANASETVRGIVEEATDAEVTAGTATGATGAKLVVTPAKLATRLGTTIADVTSLSTAKTHTVGALDNSTVKTYFNIQLPFILWTGSENNDVDTDFDNWIRTSADVYVPPMGSMAQFGGTASDSIYLAAPAFIADATTYLRFDDTNIIVMDWWGILPASSTGDIFIGGFGSEAAVFIRAYNSNTSGGSVCFYQSAAGVIYATIAKESVGVTNTDVDSGITPTQWNNFRIEFDIGNEARFYINGVLKATLSGANLPNTGMNLGIGFGRSNDAQFAVTAPNISIQMNP